MGPLCSAGDHIMQWSCVYLSGVDWMAMQHMWPMH